MKLMRRDATVNNSGSDALVGAETAEGDELLRVVECVGEDAEDGGWVVVSLCNEDVYAVLVGTVPL